MINQINNVQFNQLPQVSKTYKPLMSHYNLKADTVEFTGRSMPSEYKNVFEYLASDILSRGKFYHVNPSQLSASKVSGALDNLFENDEAFYDYEKSDYLRIKWKDYIPEDVRIFSIDKINNAREVRMAEWKKVLTNPYDVLPDKYSSLANKIQTSNALKLIIWNSVLSEIKADNRHIPVPFDARALHETVCRYEKIAPKDRAISCAQPSFIEVYTHKLRDNLLMEMGLSNNSAVWVKIPSFKHVNSLSEKEKSIHSLEILSNKNWCTRSSVDKAVDALSDGDFYIYLKRNKSSQIWEPVIGMTSLHGKIEQIQGKDNDNIIPITFLPEVKSFILKNGLKCNTQNDFEGPGAYQAILISEKLSQKDSSGTTFAKSIKDNNVALMFKFLNIEFEKLKGGLFKIKDYKPIYNLESEKGFIVPYSMFGIKEEILLSNVEEIDGDLILKAKNPLYNSRLKVFPSKLKRVTGKIVCTQEQYKKFEKDLLKVVDGDKNRIYVM